MMLATFRNLSCSRSARSPLLDPEDSRNSIELPLTDAFASRGLPTAKIEVQRSKWALHARATALFAILSVPSLLIVSVVISAWRTSPGQHSWLILGLGFYIFSALQTVYIAFRKVCDSIWFSWFLNVEIQRLRTPTLFEAVSNALATEAEKSGKTCSTDVEAVQEHDAITGDFEVKLKFWGNSPRSMKIRIGVVDVNGSLHNLNLNVDYSPGEDVICGRDSKMQSRATIVVTLRTSPSKTLKDKKLLTIWLQECYRNWVKPTQGIVKIYGLQESSTDWVPEWKFERVKPCKSVSGNGQSFFLPRDSLQKVLVDARLWAGVALRVYMISGPPGVGKSEFVVWLASQLDLQIYRLNLSSRSLTDDRLAQLLSLSSISDDAVLVQVDEFQETVERWTRNEITGVTPGGFCECLQGSAAMSKGVVVLSGTGELSRPAYRQQFSAVFRRIHCTAELGWMSNDDMRSYLRHFLAGFVVGASEADWQMCQDKILENDSPWNGPRQISIDMLKQFLMHQITEASCKEMGSYTSATTPTCVIHGERRAEFFQSFCNLDSARTFLDTYSPVSATVTDS